MNRPFRRRRYRSPSAAALLILAAIAIARLVQTHHAPSAPAELPEGTYAVERVVDGDTLLLANHARIRLLGVDTPETVKPDTPVQPWGPEASAFTKQFIGDHPVDLRLDRERVDRYHRFLAYVYVDGKLLNEELIRAGLGHVLTQYPYSEKMKRQFLAAQKEARAAHRGIWSAPARGN